MLKIDLHMHTLSSNCGLHSLWEVIQFAREDGCEIIAITDHGPAAGGVTRMPFYKSERVPAVVEGVRVLKGMELNVMDIEGSTDEREGLLDKLDLRLVGFHGVGLRPSDIETHTEAAINLIRAGGADIITHPDIAPYPLDFDRVAPVAAECGVAFEINNTNLILGKNDPDKTREMIEAGRRHDCLFALNSDGHFRYEFFQDDNARQWLREMAATDINIMNDWPSDKMFGYVEARRQMRLEAV